MQKIVGTKIILRGAKVTKVYDLNQILICEGSGNYTRFYIATGTYTEYFTAQIGILEDMLAVRGFSRVNRNTLVNIAFVKEILQGRQKIIVLTNGQKVRVSYRRSIKMFEHLF